MFRIYPAVDIMGGKCVRLYQGDLQRETVFSENPLEMALSWERQGASFLHVVDLDGAAGDSLVNLEVVREILSSVHIPVQVGGGVRRKEDVEVLLSLGAERVILGTKALIEAHFMKEMIDVFGERVIISVDTREHDISIGGWKRIAEHSINEIIESLLRFGAKRIIHTDILRDGTLEGYRLNALEPFVNKGLGIIAAGGIATETDIRGLSALTSRGLEGVILGRALYTGDLKLADILNLEEE
jgi:phosphoribosylformimino-5-aminoimidazole carboxamide ribotide isomerase